MANEILKSVAKGAVQGATSANGMVGAVSRGVARAVNFPSDYAKAKEKFVKSDERLDYNDLRNRHIRIIRRPLSINQTVFKNSD